MARVKIPIELYCLKPDLHGSVIPAPLQRDYCRGMFGSGPGSSLMLFTRRLDVVVRLRVRRITPSVLTTKIVRVGDIAHDQSPKSCKEGPNLLYTAHLTGVRILTAVDCI